MYKFSYGTKESLNQRDKMLIFMRIRLKNGCLDVIIAAFKIIIHVYKFVITQFRLVTLQSHV